MARQTREEWLAGLKPGDAISFTPPGAALPIVGHVVEWRTDTANTMVGRFEEEEFLFRDGALFDHPECLLWMVATGKGGSVGPRIIVSNGTLALAED